ncbi:unnamed protein product, partial [Ectocarpus sp. 12 AP-2014]
PPAAPTVVRAPDDCQQGCEAPPPSATQGWGVARTKPLRRCCPFKNELVAEFEATDTNFKLQTKLCRLLLAGGRQLPAPFSQPSTALIQSPPPSPFTLRCKHTVVVVIKQGR